MEALYEEAARYEALGSHDNLVQFKGVDDNGLVFEFCEKGQLAEVIQSQPSLTDNEKAEISRQVTSCLVHLHEQNSIHCDLNVNNVFVTSAMVAKIGDIQGQLYNADGTIRMPTMSQENVKSRHPHAGEDKFSQQTDIFALGTLLYYLWHGHPPFPDLDEYLDEETIQAKYRRGEFPIGDPSNGMERVISKCWNSFYTQSIEVLKDIEELGRMAMSD